MRRHVPEGTLGLDPRGIGGEADIGEKMVVQPREGEALVAERKKAVQALPQGQAMAEGAGGGEGAEHGGFHSE